MLLGSVIVSLHHKINNLKRKYFLMPVTEGLLRENFYLIDIIFSDSFRSLLV